MPELIDRQAALEIAMSYCPDDDGSCSKAGHDIREMLDEIEALPTIETEVLMIKSDAIRSLTDEETAIFEEWLNHDAAIEPEVRHGRMIEGRHPNENKCSECGQEFREEIFFIYPYDQNGISKTPKRCPECGCYWDGGDGNG